jgi:hypothetical protein
MHDPRTPFPQQPAYAIPAEPDAIVAQALAAQVVLPQPATKNDALRLVVLGIVVLLALGALALATGMIQVGAPTDGSVDVAGKQDDDNGTYSYYHDAKYTTQDNGAKWTTDVTRSTDPDQAVLAGTTRWEYDGPYKYGPYGSDGISRRAKGETTEDPLVDDSASLPDVFAADGDLDPSGGEPVGAPPSNYTNPYYDPYAGYSNPYANRIRLAYGEGYGKGASSTVSPTGSPLTSPPLG